MAARKNNIGTFKQFPKGNSGLLYVPANLVKDSLFPLKEGPVVFRFEGNRIIVEPSGNSWDELSIGKSNYSSIV